MTRSGIGVGLVVAGLCGCGIQGPPVPPEDIGVAHKVYLDKQRESKAQQKAREEQMAQQAEREAEAENAPYEGSVQPGARPGGDVQVRPR